jgi:hypothetical protein
VDATALIAAYAETGAAARVKSVTTKMQEDRALHEFPSPRVLSGRLQ